MSGAALIHLSFMFTDIRIGFAQPLYQFTEPDLETLFNNITLVKEGNRISEQTFGVFIIASDPTGSISAAQPLTTDPSLDYDYSLTGIPDQIFSTRLFPATLQVLSMPIFINGDSIIEGIEAFEVSSSTTDLSFPLFEPPSLDSTSAYQNTQIRILDNDCKFIKLFTLISGPIMIIPTHYLA